jgi:hypothetical protein
MPRQRWPGGGTGRPLGRPIAHRTRLAATDKCLAQSNKSHIEDKTTKKRSIDGRLTHPPNAKE